MRKIVLITMACAGVAAAAATVQAATTGSKVQVKSSRYGRVLFDGRGHALYLFTRDRSRASRCAGACAKNWPPFVTKGAPRAIRGARGDLLGTRRRRDGSTQVTYNGHPLYFYVGDQKAGQILCQNVTEFGGKWLVVTPTGRAVH